MMELTQLQYRFHAVHSTSVLSATKANAIHDRNAEIYPAHPSYSLSRHNSPVLSRGASGDQVTLTHTKSPEERAEDEAFERNLEKEHLAANAHATGSGSGSGTTMANEDFRIGADDDDDDEDEVDADADEALEEELQDAHARDWARRVSGDELKQIDIHWKGKEGEGA